MEVERREQSKLILWSASVEFRLCPVEIGFDFGLECFQNGKILSVNTMLREFSSIAGDVLVSLIVSCVERCFVPVEDHLQLVDTALYALDLLICLTVESVDSCCCVRILGVPNEIGHYALILTAGNESVTARLSVLLDDENRVAVLSCLRSCRDSSTARTDDYDIIGVLLGCARFVFDLSGLECVNVSAACFLCGGIDGIPESPSRERCS